MNGSLHLQLRYAIVSLRDDLGFRPGPSAKADLTEMACSQTISNRAWRSLIGI